MEVRRRRTFSVVVMLSVTFSPLIESFNSREVKKAMKQLGGGDSQALREQGSLEHEKYAEELPFRSLDRHADFELREYPRSKWACAKDVVSEAEDAFDGWQKRFDGDPFKVLAMPEWKRRSDTKMIKMLINYLKGANADKVEIPMTKPVTVRVTPLDEEGRCKLEVCVWVGTDWSSRNMPKPRQKGIYFQVMKKVKVYVREFGGWALSWQDFKREHRKLRKTLKAEGITAESNGETVELFESGENLLTGRGGGGGRSGSGSREERKTREKSREKSKKRRRKGRAERHNFFAVCYQSPLKKSHRRNEVWIVCQD